MAAPITNLIVKMSRVSCLPSLLPGRSISTSAGPLCIRNTPLLLSTVIRKKIKRDPILEMKKLEKQKSRLRRSIDLLLKKGKTLKPVNEIEGTIAFKRSKQQRVRESVQHDFEEMERRVLIAKDFSRLRTRQFQAERRAIAAAEHAQTRALERLRSMNPDLYAQCIEADLSDVPVHVTGPSLHPPIRDYVAPDGEHVDTTNRFDDASMYKQDRK